MGRTCGQDVPYTRVLLVYVQQPRLKTVPKVLFHLVGISKSPENVTLNSWCCRIFIVLSLTVIVNGADWENLGVLPRLDLLVELLHEVFEVLWGFDSAQVFQHDDIPEIVVTVEVIADLLDESCFADVLLASDDEKRGRVRYTRECLDCFEELRLVAYVGEPILDQSYLLASDA